MRLFWKKNDSNNNNNNIDVDVDYLMEEENQEFEQLGRKADALGSVFDSHQTELDAMLNDSQDTSFEYFDQAVRNFKESGVLPGDGETEKTAVRR